VQSIDGNSAGDSVGVSPCLEGVSTFEVVFCGMSRFLVIWMFKDHRGSGSILNTAGSVTGSHTIGAWGVY
jgi:hypothetical protein